MTHRLHHAAQAARHRAQGLQQPAGFVTSIAANFSRQVASRDRLGHSDRAIYRLRDRPRQPPRGGSAQPKHQQARSAQSPKRLANVGLRACACLVSQFLLKRRQRIDVRLQAVDGGQGFGQQGPHRGIPITGLHQAVHLREARHVGGPISLQGGQRLLALVQANQPVQRGQCIVDACLVPLNVAPHDLRLCGVLHQQQFHRSPGIGAGQRVDVRHGTGLHPVFVEDLGQGVVQRLKAQARQTQGGGHQGQQHTKSEGQTGADGQMLEGVHVRCPEDAP